MQSVLTDPTKTNTHTHTHYSYYVLISAQPCRDLGTIEARRKNLPDTDEKKKKKHCSIDICSAGVTTPSLLLALLLLYALRLCARKRHSFSHTLLHPADVSRIRQLKFTLCVHACWVVQSLTILSIIFRKICSGGKEFMEVEI